MGEEEAGYKFFFEILPGGGGGEKGEEEAGHKTIFAFRYFFLKFNLKILPI